MKQITVRLPDSAAEELRRIVYEHRITKQFFVFNAIMNALAHAYEYDETVKETTKKSGESL